MTKFTDDDLDRMTDEELRAKLDEIDPDWDLKQETDQWTCSVANYLSRNKVAHQAGDAREAMQAAIAADDDLKSPSAVGVQEAIVTALSFIHREHAGLRGTWEGDEIKLIIVFNGDEEAESAIRVSIKPMDVDDALKHFEQVGQA